MHQNIQWIRIMFAGYKLCQAHRRPLFAGFSCMDRSEKYNQKANQMLLGSPHFAITVQRKWHMFLSIEAGYYNCTSFRTRNLEIIDTKPTIWRV